MSQLIFYSKGRAAPSFSVVFFFSYVVWERKSKKELKPPLVLLRSSPRAAAAATPKPIILLLSKVHVQSSGRQRLGWEAEEVLVHGTPWLG